jgi:hypothetical protein
MATWITQDKDGLTVRRQSVLRWALGLCITIAILVPVVYELLQHPRSRRSVEVDVRNALIVLVGTAALGSSTVLRVDRGSRTVARSRHFLGVGWTHATSFADVEWIVPTARPNFGLLARHCIEIQSRQRSYRISLGWTRYASQATDRLADAINRLIGQDSNTTALDATAFNLGRPTVSIRRMLVAVAIAAVILGVCRSADWSSPDLKWPAALTLAMIAAAGTVLFHAGQPAFQRMLVLLTTLYVPYAWMIPLSRPWGRTSGMLGSIPLLPGLVPAMFLGHGTLSAWGAAVVTLIVLGLGAKAAFRGRKASVPFAIVAGLWSAFWSLGLYAGYRM